LAFLRGRDGGGNSKTKRSGNSALYARLIIALEHEDHMPPKDKTQLSKAGDMKL